MTKRATVHLPAERHRQLREIASRRGFSKITDLIDEWISREAGALGLADGDAAPFKISRAADGLILLAVEGVPELALTDDDARELAATISDAVEGRTRPPFIALRSTGHVVAFGARGRGYGLEIGPGLVKRGAEWHRRGFRESLALELAAALRKAVGLDVAA